MKSAGTRLSPAPLGLALAVVLGLPTSSGAGTRFQDTFGGPFPGPNWVPGGAVSIDATIGNPPPALRRASGGSVISVINPVSSGASPTFQMQIACSPGGVAVFQVAEQGNFTMGGFADVLCGTGSGPGRVNYHITCCTSTFCTPGCGGQNSNVPFNFDTAFHTFTFSIDAGGTARWYRDGILTFGTPNFPSTANLYFFVPGQSSTGPAYVDNVLVTDGVSPNATFSVNDVFIVEGNAGTTNAVFTVSLSPGLGQTATVTYATANGTATAGSDYVATSGTLTFAPGVTARTIAVPVIGEALGELNETFVVHLGSSVNAGMADSQGLGTIVNDDPPSLAIGNASVTEGDTGSANADFTVTLAPAVSQTVTVNYGTSNGTASAGSDYTATSGTLTFPPGTTTRTIPVPVLGDTLDEADETFFANLSSPTPGITIADGQGLGTILDDDPPPTLSLSDVSQAEGDTGLTTATFSVTLSAASGKTITVAYATANGTASAGSDYVASSGTLTFSPGATARTVIVPVFGDRVWEPPETYSVNLSGPTNATLLDGQGQGTITNDDTAGFSIDDVAVAEGRTGPVTATFTVTLSPPSGAPTSVDFTTADGSATAASGDYDPTAGTLSFPSNATSLPVSVMVNPDAFVEGAEAFSVVLQNPQGGPVVAFSPGTATLLDPQGGANFDGDGKTDILWRHAVSGKNVVWYMDGITRIAGVFTNPDTLPDTNWGIAGTNDFNADGKVDLLFRHAVSGKNVVWYMDGITRTAGVFTSPGALADTNWKAVGTGDFNTDGNPDILWRHGISGKNVVWYMNGVSQTGGVFTVPDALPDTKWQMVGVGDFSSDGRADILWRHGVSGKNVVWYMNDVFRTAGIFTNPDQLPDTNWQMVGVGDFNSDEKPDILFRHGVSGRNVVWYMDGITRTGGVFTNPAQLPDTNWRIVGPK